MLLKMQLPEEHQAELDEIFEKMAEAIESADGVADGLSIIRFWLNEIEAWSKEHNYYELVEDNE